MLVLCVCVCARVRVCINKHRMLIKLSRRFSSIKMCCVHPSNFNEQDGFTETNQARDAMIGQKYSEILKGPMQMQV